MTFGSHVVSTIQYLVVEIVIYSVFLEGLLDLASPAPGLTGVEVGDLFQWFPFWLSALLVCDFSCYVYCSRLSMYI